ncbi:hypothetical protein [Azospirillum argentinense]|uniref:NrdR family transcriptional regulator n=1 Tax=Azospirillum argentinense TaxID=2970906 RepID=UPI003CE5A060
MAAGRNTTIAKISGRSKPSAMACPFCGSTLNGVTETKTQADNTIRRKRVCAGCREAWMTVERASSTEQDGGHARLGQRALGGDGLPSALGRHTAPVAPLALFLPWLDDHERELLLLARQLRPEERRVLSELARSLGNGAAAGAPPKTEGVSVDRGAKVVESEISR